MLPTHLGLFPQAYAASHQLHCQSAPRGSEVSIPEPQRLHLQQDVTDSQNPLWRGEDGTGCSTLSSSDGKTMAQRGARPCLASHSNCLTQTAPLVQLPTCTSLGEGLVTTLLNPAEQLTTFHAAREGDCKQRELIRHHSTRWDSDSRPYGKSPGK
jgi:hypothetical protein